ncbi:MAG: Flp pilus assembly protein CpaB [Phenylobacterium sp.]|nr:MAG: Flp pilus assembly protein CpaB [Phenylobacterium sp.]
MQLLSSRRLKFLSMAILLSGGSVVLTEQWLHQAVSKASFEASSKAAPSAPAAGTQVLVAATALPAGAILKPGQARWQAWPAGSSTAGYLTQANTQLDQMNGAVVRTDVDAGEPLTTARIIQPGDRSFLAAVLRPGYRAITVNVTTSTGVAGFVMPGDHVDLLLSLSAGRPDGDHSVGSGTVLQDVRVLAMDQRGAETKDSKDPKKDAVTPPQTATLEVTPKGAEIVAVAGQMGLLSLSLRSLAEPRTPAPLERTVTHSTAADALGVGAAKLAQLHPPVRHIAAGAHIPAVPTVQVFRGSQSSIVMAPSGPGGAP